MFQIAIPFVNAPPPQRRPNVSCDLCGARMYRRPSTLAMNARKLCSTACRNKVYIRTGPRGPNPKLQRERNPAWKGGVTFKRNKGNYIGPKYVRCPLEFAAMARTDGYVMEHRLVVARWIGRPLTRIEAVHHEDHDTRNNTRANLSLWPNNQTHKLAEHGRLAYGAVNRWCLMG